MNVIRWAFKVGSWVPNEHEWMAASRCIQTEEKERIGRFVFKRDAKSSMAGRLLMRKFVVQATSMRSSDIRLARDERGKPYMASPDNKSIIFNVSHHGEYAVLVGTSEATSTHSIGVDVMKMEYTGGKTQEEFFRIMDRNFSEEEWRSIRRAAANEEQLASFCRHWSLKESYVKATGTGITVNLRDISFEPTTSLTTFPTSDTKLRVKRQVMSNWVFEESLLDQQHCVSIAYNFPVVDIAPFTFLNFIDLMTNSEPILPEDSEYCQTFFSKDEKP